MHIDLSELAKLFEKVVVPFPLTTLKVVFCP